MKPVTACPIEQLRRFVDDVLDPELIDEIIEHLDDCETCQQRVDQLAGSADDWAMVGEALADQHEIPNRDAEDVSATSAQQLSMGSFDLNGLLQILAPSDDPRAAGRIGTFEVLGIVGSGGMGVVIKAREPALDRLVAIKVLAPHLASSATARKRFAREARAAAAVIHDNVIAIYQVAHWNDLPYLVMPYLPDPTLQQRIDEEGCLDLEETLLIGMQVARGLSAAHSQGLVHRDVKPANILLSKGTARAVITDFGLARTMDDASLTRTGMLAGTPHYMSPEQARGETVDPRSDLFSLGSLIFAMASGRPPIDHESGSETVGQIATGTLPSLENASSETPDWLVRLVSWLHQHIPDRRPAHADEVAELLEQCLSHVRQPGLYELPEILLPAPSRSYRAEIIGGSIILMAAFIGAWFLFSSNGNDHRATFGEATRESLSESQEMRPNVDVPPPSELNGNSLDDSLDDSVMAWDAMEEQMSELRKQTEQLEARINLDTNTN